jgi:hypothetical protein
VTVAEALTPSATPDIPLREPLDFDYRVNRKLAKRIYMKEKLSRVQSNKGRNKTLYSERLNTLIKESSTREKKVIQERNA